MLLYESLREILFNVVKHAGVDYVEVGLAVGPDNTLVITVTDQGAGFEPMALDDGPTENVGFGVLSIRERLALLGGRLEIESAPGRGAQFRLIAPRATLLDRFPANTAMRTPMPSSPPLRILLVDDHRGALEALRSVLSQHPELDVVGEACNGIEAIAQAQALRPDVVLMDVSMPVMDGVEATRSIHAGLPSIQIFGLSTFEKSTDPHPIELAGATGYFQKGTDMRRLINHILAMQAGKAGSPARSSR
jgi:CheY-like chemotaxis protein